MRDYFDEKPLAETRLTPETPQAKKSERTEGNPGKLDPMALARTYCVEKDL